MSSKQQKGKSSLAFHGFRGVDVRACQTDPPSAQRLLNFRIRPDGSLEKRSGYRPLLDLGAPIRALWTGKVGGRFRGYLILGNLLYSLSFSTLKKEVIGELDTSDGKACIFFYRGDLYVLDFTGFYQWKDGALVRPVGYVPLIGRDWSQGEIGLPYEPKNILSPHARISYLITDPPTIFLCADGRIASVEALYINGILQSADKYTLDTDFNTVNVPGLSVGDRVVVHLTFNVDYSALLSELYSSLEVTLFGDANCDRLFFWGGDPGNTVFCTSFVSAAQLKESRRHYPDSGTLYFPEGFEFKIGSGQTKITGAIRHYDRLLLMTDSETWMVSGGASGLEALPAVCVNPQLGCEHSRAVVLAGNDPVSIGQGGIWRWTGDTRELNHQNALCISREIEGELPPGELSYGCLYYHRADDTLWVLLPEKEEAWILSPNHGGWSCFSNIRADFLLDLDGKVGFLHDNVIYVFESDCTTDRSKDGTESEILGIYESNLLDFGTNRKKKLSEISLYGDLGDGEVIFNFSGEGIAPFTHTFTEENHATHSMLRTRAYSGRFLFGTVTLTAPGGAKQIVHSLSIGLRES